MAAAQRLVAIKNHLEAPVLSQSAASFAAPLASAPTAAAVQRSDEEAVGIGAPLYDQTSYEKIRAEVDAFNAKFGAAPWERPAGSMTLYDPKKHGTGRWKFSSDEWSAGVLTIEERDFYDVNGYVIRRNHLDAPFLKACEQRFADICEGRIPVPKDMVVVRDISIIKRIRAGELPKSWEKSQNIVYKFNFIHTDDVLKQYIYDDKMTSMASAFCGYGLKTIDMMVINKPPDAGPSARHPLHQDLIYFPVIGPTIGVWTAINPATRENGCLSFLPGTHTMGLLRHDVPPWDEKNAGFHGVVGIDPTKLNLIYAELQPGDTVFFHPFMIHGSGKNRTRAFRKSLTGHFMSTDSVWVKDITGTSMELPIVDYQSMKEPKRVDPISANRRMREMWQTVGVYARGSKRPGDQYV